MIAALTLALVCTTAFAVAGIHNHVKTLASSILKLAEALQIMIQTQQNIVTEMKRQRSQWN